MSQRTITNDEMRAVERSTSGTTSDADELRPHDAATHGRGPRSQISARSAYDIKSVSDALSDWNDEDSKQIPVLDEGTRLEPGATYIDLKLFEPREFTARAGMQASDDNWYVPKSLVPYPLWNRLIGVQNPERVDDADGMGGGD